LVEQKLKTEYVVGNDLTIEAIESLANHVALNFCAAPERITKALTVIGFSYTF
jgi:hypothetical protein